MQTFLPCKSVIQTSYDIVKAHGRELTVETTVEEGNSDHFGKGKDQHLLFNYLLSESRIKKIKGLHR